MSHPAAVATHCPYCALQCVMSLAPAAVPVTVDSPPIQVTERADFPVNAGALCGKGRTAAELLRPDLRLTMQLVRDDSGVLRPASWDASV